MHARSLLTHLVVTVPCSLLSAQTFVPVTAPAGFPVVPLATSAYGKGICVADFDGDGDIDVVIALNSGAPFRYFRNNGGMMFSDLTAGCGLGVCDDVLCLAAADVDNDGDADLYVGNAHTPPKLFINQGQGVFSQQAAQRGLGHVTENYGVTFGDYDRDGWLDIYVGNRSGFPSGLPQANLLYRNLGNGFFGSVPGAGGAAGNRPTFAVAFIDFDEDGWPDLLEINDKGTTYGANELYRNNRDGTFSPVGAQFGADTAIDGMGIDFVDVFNDGGVDFFCSDSPTDHLFQLWQPTLNRYVNATATYGLAGGATGWAVNWLDYDNDGWQDLYVVQVDGPNLMFKNPGSPAVPAVPWQNQAPALGLALTFTQFTAAVGDFDNDGRLDLLQRFDSGPPMPSPVGVRLHRNAVVGGNWLKFRTVGTVSNRDGFGARIEVQTGNQRQRQWVRSGVGYVSGSDRRLNFGLGSAAVADRVTVTWPSGQVQYLTNVAANQIVEVREPRMGVSAPAQVGTSTSLDVSIPGDGGLPYLMALAFAAAPAMNLPDGSIVPLNFDALTGYTILPGNAILPASSGNLSAAGAASSPLQIPALPALSGLTFFATAVTFDAPGFPVLRTVFPRAVSITIQ